MKINPVELIFSTYLCTMKKRIKLLEKLIGRLEDQKDYPRDPFLNGYNSGVDRSIHILEEELEMLKKASE